MYCVSDFYLMVRFVSHSSNRWTSLVFHIKNFFYDMVGSYSGVNKLCSLFNHEQNQMFEPWMQGNRHFVYV